MSVPLHRASAAVSHTLRENAPATKRRVDDKAFMNQVSSVMDETTPKDAKAQVVRDHESPSQAADANSQPDWRQLFGGVQSSGAETASTSVDSATNSKSEQTTPAPQNTAPATPMDALKDALVSAGINPDSLDMVSHDVDVWYPSGGWTNHLITVTTATGQSENFTAELVAKRPDVTAVEIQNLLAMG